MTLQKKKKPTHDTIKKVIKNFSTNIYSNIMQIILLHKKKTKNAIKKHKSKDKKLKPC